MAGTTQAQSPIGDPYGQPQPAMPTAPASSVPTAPSGVVPGYAAPSVYDTDPYANETLIPPNTEGAPYAANAGAYCYVGPHPVDTRVAPGAPWDPTSGQHTRGYAPIDMRLFAFRGGCYYFIGDPRDFGYAGQTYNYYGAHPVLDTYGGGWCFMMGGHTHAWAPWSPYFTVVGPWNYWYGPYDPFFWAYWPYYSVYYRSYYPHYYGGGRFYRGGYRVAPPIRSIPTSTWRGGNPGRVAPTVRGTSPAQMYRPAPSYAPAQRPTFSPGARLGGGGSQSGGMGSHGSFRGGGRR
jgi:hypothetical protein